MGMTQFLDNFHFLCFPTTSSPTELSVIPSKCQNMCQKAHHVFSSLCVNLKTYMTGVAAVCQIPVTEAQNTVLEGPSLERAM